MSARSRYLQAISPRGDETPKSNATTITFPGPSPSALHNSYGRTDGFVGGSGGGNTNSPYNFNSKSPSEIPGRKVLVGGGGSDSGGEVGAVGAGSVTESCPSVKNSTFVRSSTPPPPPPPPGPPPKKANKIRQQQQPRGSGSGGSGGKTPEKNIVNTHGEKSNNAVIANCSVGAPFNESNNINDTNEQEGEQAQKEEEKVAKGGSPWSPQEEIQGGSVAKFQQMLWGGGVRGRETATGVGGVVGGEKSSGGNGGGSTLPPATPPRHTAGNSGLTTKDPSPRYKRNAPPPLENNGGKEDETFGIPEQRTTTTSSTPPAPMRKTPTVKLPTPPSRILSSPLRSGGVKNAPISGGPSTSSLRQRVGNILSLTPLDTSFGRNGDDGNTGGAQSSSPSPSRQIYPARDEREHNQDICHDAAAAPLSSSPGLEGKDKGVRDSGKCVPNGSRNNPTPNNDAHDDRVPSHPPPAAAGLKNNEGISTFTAFKRPNVKVGLVFTRRSAQHPDVAVISRIMPESIFSKHILPSPRGGGGGGTTLEGSEVIAVNGTPVRDPRHAAELVARAVEEVRLTVKRVGESGSSHLDLSPGLTDASSLSRRMKSMESDVSLLSARTEKGDEKLSALDGMEEKLDSNSIFTEKKKEGEEGEEWSTGAEMNGADLGNKSDTKVMSSSTPTRTATPKSAEIAERRRKVAQAMLLSEELVEDPIKGRDSNYFVSNNEGEDVNKYNGHKINAMTNDAVVDSRGMLTDPIQLNRSIDDDDWEENFANNDASSYGGNRKSRTAGFSTASSPSTTLSIAVSTALSGVSGTPSNVSSASAANRRRQVALEMYLSSEMVPDNVDDTRLGTIDTFGTPLTPKENSMTSLSSWMKATPLNDVGRVTSFGSTTSKARTDVTTSSVATARMGGSGKHAISPGEMASTVATLASNSFTSSTALSPSNGINTGKSGHAQGGSPTNAPTRLESPAAQRRRERAANRQLIGAGDRGGDFPVREGTPKMGDGYRPKIPASASPAAKATASKSIGTPPQTMLTSTDMAQWRLTVPHAMPSNGDLVNDPVNGNPEHFRVSKSSEESSMAASRVMSGVGSIADSGTHRSSRSALGFSKTKSRSRLREGSLDKRDGQKTAFSQVEEDPPKKKKPSIFGVARLIRKASSRKSKSSYQVTSLVDDTNLFKGASPMSTTNTSTVSSASKAAAIVAVFEEKREPDELLMSPTLLITSPHSLKGADPFSNTMSATYGDGSWEGSDFFKDNPFASSLFETDLASGDSGSKDAFGFPTKPVSDGVLENKPSKKVPSNADRVDAENIFNHDVIGPDSWGDPTAMLSVNITPRRDNAERHSNDNHHRHESLDANSCDESEMSEVTNPTFSSSSIIQTAKGKHIVDNSDSSIKENHKRESRQHIDQRKKMPLSSGSASLIEKRNAVNRDPPLVSLGTIGSSENERDDKNRYLDGLDTSITTLPVAKSRILSKYASSGKVRRGSVRSSVEDSRSIGSAGSNSLNSATGKPRIGIETSPTMISTSTSFNLNSACKSGATAAASAVASGIALAKISSKSGGASPEKQQNRGTSSSLNRRRKSPVRISTASTDGNSSLVKSSSPTRSPNRKYDSPVRKKKVSPSVVENPAYYSMETRLGQIKDPIQRAGVKLLWAAAIPIQTQARRFIARQVAIRRMCAVLTIQAFARRWIAERDLEIAIWSAIQIQASFRGWFARDSLEDKHYCATQIQRVARGYLATMHVFEDLYNITIVQSVVRMHLAINRAVDRLSSIIAIQSWWRGVDTRHRIEMMDYSAVAIQTQWRRYIAQITYQFDIIDIVIVQSVARRWKDRRALATKRLQCFARVIIAKKRLKEKKAMHALLTRHISATKIQARWRSHTARVVFIRHISATKIQARWRSYTAQVDMLVTIVNVIVIQSLWRRRKAAKLYKPLLHRLKLAKERKRLNSAISIQSAWRGFIVYSTYLIKRYENKAASTIQATWRGYWQATNYSILYSAIVKIQAFVRGYQDRAWYAFQYRCATIIQASARRLLVRKECHTECMVSILIAAAANSLRMRNAATRLQFWWMDKIWKKKEKHAALVIERFFIYVKKEVEKEVAALKKKKKEKRRRRKIKQSDDYILERAWLGVADDTVTPLVSQKAVASHKPPIVNTAGDKLRTKHNRFRARGAIQSFDEDVQSDVSGLTDLDFGYRNNGTRRSKKKSQVDLEEDLSLEEALHDSEDEMSNEQRKDVTDEFTQRHGKSRHGFSGQESSPYRDQRARGYRGYDR